MTPTASAASAGAGQETSVTPIDIKGRVWHIGHPSDTERLWDAMDTLDEDERIPYWAEIWPSSLALGAWIHEHGDLVKGCAALDMGCGVGLTALVGRSVGARVVGMDYEAEALRYARMNAVRNRIAQPCWAVMDWRVPAVRRNAFPFVWAGDIMYERRFAIPILDFITFAMTETGTAWIAEPCRSVYDALRKEAPGKGLSCDCVRETEVRSIVPQPAPVPVRIWQLRRKDTA